MEGDNERPQVLVPHRSAPIEQITEFAATYDGYSLIAAEPEQLERVLWPVYEEVERTSIVPAWIGLDLARALLFYAQRLGYWSGGSNPEEPLRALVDHIGEVSGGRVVLRQPDERATPGTPASGSVKHDDYADSWEYSPDGVYRWWYERRWAPGPTMCFVGLNPSTGDTDGKSRPTLAKVVGWAKREGCGALTVVNLFAFRATKPDALFASKVDIVGDRNDATIREQSQRADITLVAWGAERQAITRAAEVLQMLSDPKCVGKTKSGAPKHPLSIRGSQPLENYP